MSVSKKYGRTFHYPFSPGTTQDDKVNAEYWNDIQAISQPIHTEKLDGENNCLNRYGVFARSHAAPAQSPWTLFLRQKWELLRYDLGDLEIFGENLYAIHSIEYPRLDNHFYVFGIRENERWLSWEETLFWGNLFEFQTVPVIGININTAKEDAFKRQVLDLVGKESHYGSMDVHSRKSCSMEGIVTRNVDGYHTEDFHKNVFKYVRKNHVKTDEHWAKNWKRAKLISEGYVADQ